MISERMFQLKKNGEPRKYRCYCRNPELIENYDKAIADETQIWDCHHRREEFYSYKELIERGEYFDVSPEELIFLTKAEHSKIDSCCKRISETKKGKSLSEESKRKISEAQKNRKDQSKKVLCVETGELFESIMEASRKTGVDFSNISKVCSGKLKTTGGYHWKYLEAETES